MPGSWPTSANDGRPFRRSFAVPGAFPGADADADADDLPSVTASSSAPPASPFAWTGVGVYVGLVHATPPALLLVARILLVPAPAFCPENILADAFPSRLIYFVLPAWLPLWALPRTLALLGRALCPGGVLADGPLPSPVRFVVPNYGEHADAATGPREDADVAPDQDEENDETSESPDHWEGNETAPDSCEGADDDGEFEHVDADAGRRRSSSSDGQRSVRSVPSSRESHPPSAPAGPSASPLVRPLPQPLRSSFDPGAFRNAAIAASDDGEGFAQVDAEAEDAERYGPDAAHREAMIRRRGTNRIGGQQDPTVHDPGIESVRFAREHW